MNTSNQLAQRGNSRSQANPRAAVPVKLSREQLHALSRINPWISAYHILLEWSSVVLAVILCQLFWNPLVYATAVVFIGARQHAMLILMHDGTHYRLFRNRRMNDWLTEVLLAWPHLVTMHSYRQNHLAHHNYVNSDRDPDWLRKKDNPEWRFPQSLASLLGIFARDLSGIGGINLIRLASSLSSAAQAPGKTLMRLRLAFYVSVLVTATALGGGKILLLYWIVPYFTWLILIMRIRSIAEHFAIDRASEQYGHTRTTYAGLLARVFIAPKNVNYHIEHHFFPSVPFYRLPQLHALLMSQQEFAAGAHVSTSYTQMLKECMRRTRTGEVNDGIYQQASALAAAGR